MNAPTPLGDEHAQHGVISSSSHDRAVRYGETFAATAGDRGGEKKPCPDTLTVLRCLGQHGYDLSRREKIQQWLRRGLADKDEAHRLSRVIWQWKKTPHHVPRLASLKALSAATDISVDALLEVAPRSAGPPASTVSVSGKEWLRRYFSGCQRLSCYAVYVPLSDVENWRDQAAKVTERVDRVALAESWAKQIKVFSASTKLKLECGFADDSDLASQSMLSLIEIRLGWILGADGARGAVLASKARSQVLEGMFKAVRNQARSGANDRYPSLHPEQEGAPTVLSLRVSFDTLPSDENELGWIVYYLWGPKLPEEEVTALLNK